MTALANFYLVIRGTDTFTKPCSVKPHYKKTLCLCPKSGIKSNATLFLFDNHHFIFIDKFLSTILISRIKYICIVLPSWTKAMPFLKLVCCLFPEWLPRLRILLTDIFYADFAFDKSEIFTICFFFDVFIGFLDSHFTVIFR